MVIIGKTGCGKTEFLRALVPVFSDSIRTVIIATVLAGTSVHEELLNDFVDSGRSAVICHKPELLMGDPDNDVPGELDRLRDDGTVSRDSSSSTTSMWARATISIGLWPFTSSPR
jgi:energy-coupling factor transporter ATP-binding protein EcfA2